jgi:2-polyprenyl-3-methyl-5-hydroxy-6-metoxy-1,4-benzoquinol methylase
MSSIAGSWRGRMSLTLAADLESTSISFAEMGAAVRFTDIVEENVRVVERLCRLKGLNAKFLYTRDLEDFDPLATNYAVVTALGSLINAPLAFTKMEVSTIKQHLRHGGRLLYFAYLKSRWEREGSVDFSNWRELTDGP